jgi:hypothetical protein
MGMRRVTGWVGGVLIPCAFAAVAWSQPEIVIHEFEPYDDVPLVVSFLGPFIVPKVFQDAFLLKQYIRSEEFAAFRKRYGDVHAVDAIFHKAMRLSLTNTYEALFISCIATMDHRRFGVNLPVVGPILWFPLTSEFEDEFRDRIRALPSRLYDDTPRSGDRDKLQHFFGSAFLAIFTESSDAAQRFGDFIEWGEDMFIVDGALDDRDYRANVQGQQFGLRLMSDHRVYPSQFLHSTVAASAHEPPFSCFVPEER